MSGMTFEVDMFRIFWCVIRVDFVGNAKRLGLNQLVTFLMMLWCDCQPARFSLTKTIYLFQNIFPILGTLWWKYMAQLPKCSLVCAIYFPGGIISGFFNFDHLFVEIVRQLVDRKPFLFCRWEDFNCFMKNPIWELTTKKAFHPENSLQIIYIYIYTHTLFLPPLSPPI